MLPDLIGKTVLIVGNSPGMSQAAVNNFAMHADYTIAVNRGVVHAPHADAMVSIDGNWPDVATSFEGLRIVGVPVDGGIYVYLPHEVVTLAPGNVVHLRNNTLSAIRLAVKAGATTIDLIGFDPAAYERKHDFHGFVEGLSALINEMHEWGVHITIHSIPELTPARKK